MTEQEAQAAIDEALGLDVGSNDKPEITETELTVMVDGANMLGVQATTLGLVQFGGSWKCVVPLRIRATNLTDVEQQVHRAANFLLEKIKPAFEMYPALREISILEGSKLITRASHHEKSSSS